MKCLGTALDSEFTANLRLMKIRLKLQQKATSPVSNSLFVSIATIPKTQMERGSTSQCY